MKNTMTSDGTRIGYIFAGILTIILAIALVFLFFPAFMGLFGLTLWSADFILDLISSQFIELIVLACVLAIPLLFALCNLFSLFVRRSKSNTFFRLCVVFASLSFLIQVDIIGSLLTLDATISSVLLYVKYAFAGIALIMLILGLIFRSSKKFDKYHENRASTYIVFISFVWLLLAAFSILPNIVSVEVIDIIFVVPSTIYLGLFGVLLLIMSIWQFCCVKHRYLVSPDGNTTRETRNVNANAGGNRGGQVNPANAGMAMAPGQFVNNPNGSFAQQAQPQQQMQQQGMGVPSQRGMPQYNTSVQNNPNFNNANIRAQQMQGRPATPQQQFQQQGYYANQMNNAQPQQPPMRRAPQVQRGPGMGVPPQQAVPPQQNTGVMPNYGNIQRAPNNMQNQMSQPNAYNNVNGTNMAGYPNNAQMHPRGPMPQKPPIVINQFANNNMQPQAQPNMTNNMSMPQQPQPNVNNGMAGLPPKLPPKLAQKKLEMENGGNQSNEGNNNGQ